MGLNQRLSEFMTEQRVKELYIEKDMSLQEIANIYNVTPSHIHYYIKKYKIPPRSSTNHSKKTKEKISKAHLELYRSGKITNWNTGKPRNESTKRKISEVLKKGYREGTIKNLKKGKTFEELYGIEKAQKLKYNHSIKMKNKLSPRKGKKYPHVDGCQCPFCRAKRGEFVGEGNPFYGKTHSDVFGEWKSNSQLGDKNNMWCGGISFESYPIEFNPVLKRKIRKRDNQTCVICGKKGRTVHHIDYDKTNCDENNLITTCRRCHGKTNQNRDYWQSFLSNIVKSRPDNAVSS